MSLPILLTVHSTYCIGTKLLSRDSIYIYQIAIRVRKNNSCGSATSIVEIGILEIQAIYPDPTMSNIGHCQISVNICLTLEAVFEK